MCTGVHSSIVNLTPRLQLDYSTQTPFLFNKLLAMFEFVHVNNLSKLLNKEMQDTQRQEDKKKKK